jgi:hypothetical protein
VVGQEELDAGGFRLAGEVVVELVADEDQMNGLMGVGVLPTGMQTQVGGEGEEGGVLL